MSRPQQEKQVNSAFSKKSKVYEAYGKQNPIIQWSRKQVYHHVLRFLPHNASILELNGGTGEDALYFAERGHSIHIMEIADGMIEKIQEKIKKGGYPGSISFEKRSYLELNKSEKGNYDYIYSNFGGLNLTPNLSRVFHQFKDVLKPGGYVTLVMLNPISIWEIFTVFWNFRTALRRLPSLFGLPVPSRVAGVKVNSYYFTANQVFRSFTEEFDLIAVQGLCTLVPPSYFDPFPFRYPRFFKLVKRMEERFSHLPPLINLGDFFIITMRYNPKL